MQTLLHSTSIDYNDQEIGSRVVFIRSEFVFQFDGIFDGSLAREDR
jgi:hypothetical protein